MKTNLTNLEQAIYDKLLQNGEGGIDEIAGIRWKNVYLPNVGNTKEFAGILSSLTKKGLYREVEKDFGRVKI